MSSISARAPRARQRPLTPPALAQVLESGGSREWPCSLKMHSAAGIATGLAFLHEQCVVHCDLKPDNVLYSEASFRTPKIADFGESLLIKDTSRADGRFRSPTQHSRKGTLLFSAPEQISEHRHDRAVDMWAFGCALVCIFTDRISPYPADMPMSELFSSVVAGRRQPALPVAHPMHGFVRDCCKTDPSCRPLAADLAKKLEAASERLAFLQRQGASASRCEPGSLCDMTDVATASE